MVSYTELISDVNKWSKANLEKVNNKKEQNKN